MNGKRALAGIVLSGIGGKFRVETEDGNILICTARGVLRRGGGKLLPGDRVTVEICTDIKLSDGIYAEDSTGKESGASFPGTAGTARDGSDGVISELIPRKNELIRPPLANLERIFAVISSAFPEPSTLLADKLITIAEHEGIEPIIVISKRDLSPENAERLTDIYI
ncbi:MAG: GTPase RsgA, partial [Christensenellales bacterium]